MGNRWPVQATADRLMNATKKKVAHLHEHGCTPHLAVVLVGEDPASKVYVEHKIRACKSLGIHSTFKNLPDDSSTEDLLSTVRELNQNPRVHGILVQLPLPKHIEEQQVIHAIDPRKDVDGFHPINVGLLSLGQEGLFPCTPMGVMELLKDGGIPLKGKHAVIVGRSNIVGKPMAQLLLKEHCTVSILHSRTVNPEALCKQADIVVVAVGRPGLVDASWLKPGAWVIDIGINQITEKADAERLLKASGKKMANFIEKGHQLYGDVNYLSALQVADKVTPVPGGVGKLTIAHLMYNCTLAAERMVST